MQKRGQLDWNFVKVGPKERERERERERGKSCARRILFRGSLLQLQISWTTILPTHQSPYPPLHTRLPPPQSSTNPASSDFRRYTIAGISSTYYMSCSCATKVKYVFPILLTQIYKKHKYKRTIYVFSWNFRFENIAKFPIVKYRPFWLQLSRLFIRSGSLFYDYKYIKTPSFLEIVVKRMITILVLDNGSDVIHVLRHVVSLPTIKERFFYSYNK